nr:MAG TPA: Replication associated protein [Microviridae sp.]
MTEKEREKYLATECFHPRKVTNRYTHETLFVRCGTCPSCLVHRSNIQCALISNMSSHFKYAYFFTLTYSDEFVPRISLEVVERCGAESEIDAYMSDSDPRHLPYDDSKYQIAATYLPRSGCFRVHDSGRVRDFSETEDSYQFLHTFSGKEIRDLLVASNGRYDFERKCVVFPSIDECRNEVLVLNPYDQNLFFKRLRKLIAEKYDEKICYYLVSEYGGRTYRPHWHGILFFNSDALTSSICELVSKSWSYGRTDCSLSRGSAAGYVASYINSFVDLPDFFNRHKEIKPRSYHSKGLSVNSLFCQSSDISKVREVAASCFDGFSVPINGEYVTVKPSRSYEHTVFPRISDPFFSNSYCFADLFFGAFTASNRLIRDGYISIDESLSIYEISKRYAKRYYDIRSGHIQSFYYDSLIFKFIRLEFSQIDFDCVVGKIYRFFSAVNRTLRFWKLDSLILPQDLKRSLMKLFDASIEYWSKKELRFINDFYDYLSAHPESQAFLNSRSVNFVCPSKEDTSFWTELNFTLSSLKKSVTQRIFQKVKHKNYNDISGLLFNLNF